MKIPVEQLKTRKEWADRISLAKIGHKHSEETKIKIGIKTRERAGRTRAKRSESMRGKNSGENNSSKRPVSLYPELRFAIDNGRTLCVPCHKTTDTFGRKIYGYKK